MSTHCMQGLKRDWNAGEVGIPKFHCPRCRDHWYGITPFPCDEELARLIREGLWYTGKGDTGKINTRTTPGEQGIRGKGGSSSSLNRESDSSPQRTQRHTSLKVKTSENNSSETGIKEAKKNKKKRITFKLDERDETESSLLNNKYDQGFNSDVSSVAANHGLGRERDENGKSPSNSNFSNENGSNLPNSSHLSTSTGKDENGLSSDEGFLVGSGSNTSLTRGQRRKGKGNNSGVSSTDMTKEASEEDSNRSSKGGRIGKRGSGIGLSDEAGMGLANALAGNRDHRRPLSGSSQAKDVHGDHNVTNGGAGVTSSTDGNGTCTDDKDGLRDSDEKQFGCRESLQHASQSSIASNQSKKAEVGPDYGRKVRKPGGYMRAASPTGSEWGDPAHARPYASSTTASSQTGSTSNLYKDKSALPPIIPPIKAPRKPTLDFSEGRFELTPPWRFSYFTPSPLHSAARRPVTATTANTRRRK